MSQATSILEEHLQKHDIAGLMARSAALRGELWGPLCRIVLAVRDERDIDGHTIKWNDLPLGDVHAKVTLDDLRAWLSTGAGPRPYQAVQKLASLFDVLDMDPPLPAVPYPQTVTLVELLALSGEVAPVYLPALLPSPHFHVRQRLFDLHVLVGEALGVGHALAKTSLDSLIAGQLKHGTLEAIGAYLRDGTEHLHPQDFTELGRRLPADPPAWINEAYARACLVAVERTKNFRSYELTIQTRALTAPQIEACLLAARRKSALWSLVAAQVAVEGQPQGAAALAAVIGDKKFGAEAARWLAAMGAVGRAAAAARPPSADDGGFAPKPPPRAIGAEEKRIKPLLAAIAALPDAPSVFAGYQLQMPRFGLDVSSFLIKTPAAGEARVASTPLDDLEKAFSAPLVQEALPPSGWADALQIISLDNRLTAVPFAHARALAAGLLGRGADEASLVAALDRLDWCANVTRQWGGNKAHLGHILLWAGASERVFLHGIARFHL